jgi:hypothetical protein
MRKNQVLPKSVVVFPLIQQNSEIQQGSIWIARIYTPNSGGYLWCFGFYWMPDPCNP